MPALFKIIGSMELEVQAKTNRILKGTFATSTIASTTGTQTTLDNSTTAKRVVHCQTPAVVAIFRTTGVSSVVEGYSEVIDCITNTQTDMRTSLCLRYLVVL